METLGGSCLSFAKEAIGQKEKPGNMGFKDPKFDKEMRELGRFQDGWAWCLCFVERSYKKGYLDYNYKNTDAIFKEMAKLITPSAVRTLENFKNADGWVVSKVPIVGAIALWQKFKDGKPTSKGHGGIVSGWTGTHVTTVDGNTNASGGREGNVVAEKSRRMNFNDTKGLVLQAFVYPKE